MNKRFFQLRYDPHKNQYIVEPIAKGNNIDRTKILDKVLKYNQYTWVCTNKKSLIDYVEVLKNERISDLERQMKVIQGRLLVVNNG